MGRSPRQEKCLLGTSSLSQSWGRLEPKQPSNNHSELLTQVINGGGFCVERGVCSKLSGPDGKMDKQCRCFESKNPRNLVERMLKMQVCGKRSVCVVDNLYSQNPLLRLSSTSSDPDLSGQGSEILSARYMQVGPHSREWGRGSLGACTTKRMSASGHLGSHTTHPHTPLFIAYCADCVTSNNVRHRIKRETFRSNYSLNLTTAAL